MSVPPPTPAERFAMLIAWFTHAVGMHTGWDRVLTPALIGHITDRLRRIKWTVLRLAARIQAGRYVRGTRAPRHRAIGTSPRRPDPLPRARNWLEPMLTEVVPGRGHLLDLLQDPEMVALIEAAPEAMGRPLRSLCRMLGLRPPPILAIPKTPRPAPAAKPRRAAAPPKPPSSPPRPAPGRSPWRASALVGIPAKPNPA